VVVAGASVTGGYLRTKLAVAGLPLSGFVYGIISLRHGLQVLLSEVMPWKLEMMDHVEAWVQVACPRLSIDWGEGFGKPTLTPYEAMIALHKVLLRLPSPVIWVVFIVTKSSWLQ